MNLGEILENYIKLEKNENGFKIFVVKPEWISPYETTTEWVLAYEMDYEQDDSLLRLPDIKPLDDGMACGFEKYGIYDPDICKGLERVLDRKTFFKTCDDCGRRNHTFHMEGRICNSCIPEIPGVVY